MFRQTSMCPPASNVCSKRVLTTLDARTRQSAAHRLSEIVRTQRFQQVTEGVPVVFRVSAISDTTAHLYFFPRGNPRSAELRFSAPPGLDPVVIPLNPASNFAHTAATDMDLVECVPNTQYVFRVSTSYQFNNTPAERVRTYTDSQARQFWTHGPPMNVSLTDPFDGILRWSPAKSNPGERVVYQVSLEQLDPGTLDPLPGTKVFVYTQLYYFSTFSGEVNLVPGLYEGIVTAVYTLNGAIPVNANLSGTEHYAAAPVRFEYV